MMKPKTRRKESQDARITFFASAFFFDPFDFIFLLLPSITEEKEGRLKCSFSLRSRECALLARRKGRWPSLLPLTDIIYIHLQTIFPSKNKHYH